MYFVRYIVFTNLQMYHERIDEWYEYHPDADQDGMILKTFLIHICKVLGKVVMKCKYNLIVNVK